MRLRSTLFICGRTLLCAGAGWAQDSTSTAPHPAAPVADSASSAGWQFIVEPYLLVPSMSGSAGVAGLTADVKANSGDIFSVFESGAMLYLEMHDPLWAISLDGLYMHLGDSGSTRLGTVDVDLKQSGVMLAGYRRVKPWAEVMLGIQFNAMDVSLKGSGPVAVDQGTDQNWVDPYVGVRVTAPRADKWRFSFLGAIGGFGIGSDFAWQVFPQVGYRFSPLFELHGGYRAFGMDYSNGSGTDQFDYNLTTYGPQVGARFHF